MKRSFSFYFAYLLIITTIGLACMTWLFPQLDLKVEAIFFDYEARHFPWHNSILTTFVYKAVQWLAIFYMAVMVLGVLIGIWKWWREKDTVFFRNALFLIISYSLGAGAMVHYVYKPYFGRARPREVVEFHGEKLYFPPYKVAGQCLNSNCSFVSGHAAMGYSMGLPAFFDKRRRYAWINTGILCGMIFGIGRIMQGAHFLGDVLWSAVVVFVTGWLVHMAFLAVDKKLRKRRGVVAATT